MSSSSVAISPLVQAGAQISLPLNITHSSGQYDKDSRLAIIDWVERQIETLKKEYEELLKEDKKDDRPLTVPYQESPQTWMQQRSYIAGKLTEFRETKRKPSEPTDKSERKKKLERSLAYYEDVLGLLQSKDAKGYYDLYPEQADKFTKDKLRREDTVQFPKDDDKVVRQQYELLSNRYSRTVVQPHLLDQYDALFEACWTGDNARIEELCLPPKTQVSERQPIQITARSVGLASWHGIRPTNLFGEVGAYTPLAVAFLARKWDTARLIMAIASAQYHPDAKATDHFGAGIIDLRKHSYPLSFLSHVLSILLLQILETTCQTKWKRMAIRMGRIIRRTIWTATTTANAS